ncbi:MAG: copper-binding protein, partial [Gammaproteobacteria bacterium]
FRAAQVVTGMEDGDRTEVLRGLEDGAQVVVSGQFLIDSEASLKGVEARLNEPAQPTSDPASAPQRYESQATIAEIGQDTVTLAHDAIPALKWGPMTMEFKLPARDQRPASLKVGDPVAFEFYMEKEGPPQLTRLTLLKGRTSVAGNAAASRPNKRVN